MKIYIFNISKTPTSDWRADCYFVQSISIVTQHSMATSILGMFTSDSDDDFRLVLLHSLISDISIKCHLHSFVF